jgi:outer membrane protein insertion porin family
VTCLAARVCVVVVYLVVAGRAHAQSEPEPAAIPTTLTVAPPAPPAIERVEIRGNHRIEADTIRLQLGSKPGRLLDPVQLRADLRAIWQLGTFSDVRVGTEPASGNVIVTFEVTERPSIRKVLVAGNQELALDKINDVLDLRRDTAADMVAVRRNRDKVAALYLDHGFLLSTVDVELLPVGPTEVDVRFTIDEHAKVRIRDVEFTGNTQISDSDLRDIMTTRRPNALSFMNDSGIYRRDALERDLSILTALYLDRGYATVKIGSPALRLSRDKKYMHVTIAVDEGPRFTFGTVDIKGDLVGTAAANFALIESRTGDTFSRTRVERDRKALETYYQDQGYAHVNVVPRMRLDHPNRRVVLGFEIARGKRVYIDRIHIRGNSKSRDKLIRRELKISEGELFSGSKLEKSRRMIFALGFFETVTIDTAPGSSDEYVDVNVEVHERRTGSFQIGAGFSSVESFIAQGQVAYDNFLGRGQSLSFQAQISSLRRMFTFRFVEPYFLDTQWMFAAELYNQSRGFGAFSRNATGGALTWGHPLSDHARASVTYRLEDVGITAGSGGIANFGARSEALPSVNTANLMRGGLTSSVRGTLSWDSRNNRLLPTDGWSAQVFAEYAGRLTASENQFVRWGGFVRHYRRLANSPFVLRLNGELGVTTSIDGKGVPLSERYLLGGIYDIRGYQPRSIGPQLFSQRPGDVGQTLDPLPLGGNLQLVGNAEVEFPLVKKLGLSGVVFFDIGNAYNLEDRYCSRGAGSPVAATIDACIPASGMLGGLRKSIGVGVRWQSPIGPLRFEWGIPLDLKPGEQGSGLDFTIGTSF